MLAGSDDLGLKHSPNANWRGLVCGDRKWSSYTLQFTAPHDRDCQASIQDASDLGAGIRLEQGLRFHIDPIPQDFDPLCSFGRSPESGELVLGERTSNALQIVGDDSKSEGIVRRPVAPFLATSPVVPLIDPSPS